MDEKLNQSPLPYLTTPHLLSMFSSYKYPRDKIKNLVKTGDLIPIKQGLYLIGQKYSRSYSNYVLAGMIYGPSAISFETALSYHNLIPERVTNTTSLCFKKNKTFKTPIGSFEYRYISRSIYPIGIDYQQVETGNFFIASPEKAICDIAYFQKLESKNDAHEFLFEDLRIDKDQANQLNHSLLHKISLLYKRKSVMNTVESMLDSKGQ